jgi:hypothetical protein
MVLCMFGACGVLHAGDSVTVLAKTWQVGYSVQDDQQQLNEYVLPGETVENWSALVSRQFVFDPESKFQIKRLLWLIRSGFGTDCINFTWTIVKQSKTDALYTWSHDGCENSRAEAERALMRRVPGGLCRWSYATRVDPLHTKNLSELDSDLARQSCTK